MLALASLLHQELHKVLFDLHTVLQFYLGPVVDDYFFETGCCQKLGLVIG